MDGLRLPKRIGLALAVLSGALLFSFHPAGIYPIPGFTRSHAALLLCGNCYYSGAICKTWQPKLAGGLSLLLWTGVICAGRGPATIKDVMHSMVDPNGDDVFASVQQVADRAWNASGGPADRCGLGRAAPPPGHPSTSPQLWCSGRKCLALRDRSRNPQSESQPEQIEQALDADRPSLAPPRPQASGRGRPSDPSRGREGHRGPAPLHRLDRQSLRELPPALLVPERQTGSASREGRRRDGLLTRTPANARR